MTNRIIKITGKGTEVNAEGNEKVDNTSTASNELDATQIHNDNMKVAGLSNGKKLSDIANKVK